VLELRDFVCCYGKVAAVKGISLTVERGQLVALIGANGAGKTTTLKAISGLLPVAGGKIIFDGQDITNASSRKILSLGIAHCPEGRHVFPYMSVAENLEMGCYLRADRPRVVADFERIFEQFPRLAERRTQIAGSLSGGEQQMLSIARGLMSGPRLMILDEPSLGLAPQRVQELFRLIGEVAAGGVSIVLVEQNVHQSLRIAARGYVMEKGRVVLGGTGHELLGNEFVQRAFLGR